MNGTVLTQTTLQDDAGAPHIDGVPHENIGTFADVKASAPESDLAGQARRFPWAALLVMALMGFLLIATETMPAGLLPQIASGLDAAEGPPDSLSVPTPWEQSLRPCPPSPQHGACDGSPFSLSGSSVSWPRTSSRCSPLTSCSPWERGSLPVPSPACCGGCSPDTPGASRLPNTPAAPWRSRPLEPPSDWRWGRPSVPGSARPSTGAGPSACSRSSRSWLSCSRPSWSRMHPANGLRHVCRWSTFSAFRASPWSWPSLSAGCLDTTSCTRTLAPISARQAFSSRLTSHS